MTCVLIDILYKPFPGRWSKQHAEVHHQTNSEPGKTQRQKRASFNRLPENKVCTLLTLKTFSITPSSSNDLYFDHLFIGNINLCFFKHNLIQWKVWTEVSQCLWLVDRAGWCNPEMDYCWLWPRWVNVCGWLIVRVGVVLRRTVVGCDPGESMFVVGWSCGLV